LGGEIRSVSQIALRLNEAEKLGFKEVVIPKNNYKNLNYGGALEIVPVSDLMQALDIKLGR
jgi:DNA repair protein RadA/Sms